MGTPRSPRWPPGSPPCGTPTAASRSSSTGAAGRATTGDFARAEVAGFVGKNPWQSHHIPEARRTLKAIKADPSRSLVVIDPRRTENARIEALQ
jgi:anaerobic selenocysteine-containing dehydrogenase